MRILLILTFTFSFALSANENLKTEQNKTSHESAKKENKIMAKEAYLKAKNECLAENHELKGKALKDCIVKKQTEAK